MYRYVLCVYICTHIDTQIDKHRGAKVAGRSEAVAERIGAQLAGRGAALELAPGEEATTEGTSRVSPCPLLHPFSRLCQVWRELPTSSENCFSNHL